MPMYTVTVEAKRIIEMNQTITVEAKNSAEAKRMVQAMINRNQIAERSYEELTSYIADESVAGVEKQK